MNFKGFEFEKSLNMLKVIFPDELKNVFFAEFYGRSALLDEANGNPEIIWKHIPKCCKNKLVAPEQVHLDNAIQAVEEYALPLRPKADAICINAFSNCMASLRFADCIPVIVAGISDEPWLCIIHSGFWGTVLNISASVVKQYKIIPDRTWAWILPGICVSCYSRHISDYKTEKALTRFGKNNYNFVDDKVYFDLKGEICASLENAGLYSSNIYNSGICTYDNTEVFYSYRAGDIKKRNFLLSGCLE